VIANFQENTFSGDSAMQNPGPKEFHRKLDMLSQRLQVLRLEFREHSMVSDADLILLDRVQQETH
jgi:hypothetical protein